MTDLVTLRLIEKCFNRDNVSNRLIGKVDVRKIRGEMSLLLICAHTFILGGSTVVFHGMYTYLAFRMILSQNDFKAK